MVAVLEAARIYIEELRIRNAKLEGNTSGGMPRAVSPTTSLSSRVPYSLPSTMPSSTPSILIDQIRPLPQIVRKESSESDDGRAFRKGRAELVDQLPPVSAFVPPESTVFAPPRPNSPTLMPRAPSALVPGTQFPNMARPSLLASVIQESFSTPALRTRKDSGLLLPTDNPETFYFGHRDSMQTLLAVPLPMILDEKSESYVKCIKCHRGVDGLVMIDCDQCRKWYHIRCVNINATSIPVRWSCPECPLRN